MTANRVIDVERDESGAPLQAIFDSVPEGLVVARQDGLIRLAHRAADAHRHHEISRQTGIAIQAAMQNVPEGIPRPISTGLYRIAQEAIPNLAKHSGAKSASVTLSFEQGVLRLAIIDDGRRFDPGTQEVNPGIGMIGMRERVRMVDGKLSVVEAWIDQ